ncbi:hypothetical protein AKJ16_DCAP01841 [Drosera capensis]
MKGELLSNVVQGQARTSDRMKGGSKVAEVNPFLAPPFRYGEKEVAVVVFPCKLSRMNEGLLGDSEVGKGDMGGSEDGEEATGGVEKRPRVQFKLSSCSTRKRLGALVRNEVQESAVYFDGEDEKDAERLAKVIMKKSVEIAPQPAPLSIELVPVAKLCRCSTSNANPGTSSPESIQSSDPFIKSFSMMPRRKSSSLSNLLFELLAWRLSIFAESSFRSRGPLMEEPLGFLLHEGLNVGYRSVKYNFWTKVSLVTSKTSLLSTLSSSLDATFLLLLGNAATDGCLTVCVVGFFEETQLDEDIQMQDYLHSKLVSFSPAMGAHQRRKQHQEQIPDLAVPVELLPSWKLICPWNPPVNDNRVSSSGA